MGSRHSGGARGIGWALAGLAIGMLLITPAAAHFTQNTRHLGKHVWQQVVKAKVYTKNQANNRFLGSNVEVVQVNGAYNSTSPKGVTASCPPGKIAVGGGGGLRGEGLAEVDPPELALQDVVPSITNGVPTGMTATGVEAEPFATNWRVAAYAICATG